jgi:hypothetical protein
MLFGETVAVYCENHTEQAHTVWAECRVSTSQETHYFSATKPNRLILFGETVALFCQKKTEHTHTLCVQNIEFVPHRKHFVSATKPIRLLLFGETIDGYCENHTEPKIHCVGRMKSLYLTGNISSPLQIPTG